MYQTQIGHPELIGRLMTGLYTLSDGHIYFNNNVIKIRYDLIDNINNQKYREDDIFDHYLDIFDLPDGMKIQSSTPNDSKKVHKFVYIMCDENFERPKELLVVPYLHDRRIYFNRIKINTRYFYTTIETPVADEEDYRLAIEDDIQKALG